MDLPLAIVVISTACSILGGVLNAISGGAGMVIVPLASAIKLLFFN